MNTPISHADLLDAEAAIDWAVAQMPILEQRIVAWRETGPYRILREFDPQRGKDALKVCLDHPLPRIINADAEAIVHSIRSGLDLLAFALAERNGHAAPKNVYFPICDSLTAFLDTRRGGGHEKITRLSPADVAVIEKLKPYKGGNDLLYSLHQMDILRKHRRLLEVHADLGHMTLGHVWEAEFPDGWHSFKNQAVLAWISPAFPEHDLSITLEITVRKIPTLVRRPIIDTLDEVSSLARSIIKIFD